MEEKERYELIGCCSYRDTETGVIGDNFVGLLNEQDQKIKDLEVKLAEYQNDRVGDVILNAGKKIKELQQQLAESKRNNLILYSMLYETLEKQGCENVASQIDQMTGLMLEKQADWFKGNKLFNQTAVAELEKVKKLLVEKMKLASDKLDCAYYIDQQIKSLKGDK